jgi:4-hydroxybenzoate polyprenyltransferase
MSRFSYTIQVMTTSILDMGYNLYLITIDDSPTFVIPNTVFGVAAAMTGAFLTQEDDVSPPINSLPWACFIYTILRTVLYNWTNLLVFDLANQRQASQEDAMNKPWRPIPSGRMTTTQMRYSLMAAIPVVLGFNHFCLHAGAESCVLGILTWMYNDLGGGDDNWIMRNWIIACAFGVYNLGSMKVAASSAAALNLGIPGQASLFGMQLAVHTETTVSVTTLGYVWAVMISGVIFTTMHVQDLKDVAGDRARGRRSAPIVLGRRITSWTIASPVIVWSAICVHFWNPPFPVLLAPILLGIAVAWRCVTMTGKTADRRTWQLWCLWTAVLYVMPPLSGRERLQLGIIE